MRIKRPALGLVGGLACTAAAILTTGVAQAATPSNHQANAHTLTAPTAPRGARPRAAAAPRISPSVPTKHVAPGGRYTCGKGRLCTAVWDPTTSNWKVFNLYKCHKYALAHWSGKGYYNDNQTGNVRSHFYGRNGKNLKSFTPGGGQKSVDWTPVWSIRNC